jgi:hypothetical protein
MDLFFKGLFLASRSKFLPVTEMAKLYKKRFEHEMVCHIHKAPVGEKGKPSFD